MEAEKETLKGRFIRHLRGRAYQPLWERLFRIAKSGMNYWNQSVYNNGEFSLLKSLVLKWDEPIIIFDIGANKGQYASLVKEAFNGKDVSVYCFEPSSNTFLKLRDTLDLLGNRPHFIAFNLGLSSNNTQAELYGNSETSVLRSLYWLEDPVLPFKKNVTDIVQLKTLDSFCEEHDIKHIHLLKIDVEGHEMEVLKGSSGMLAKGAISYIQFEFGTCNIDSKVFFRDFYNLLAPQYRLYRLLPNSRWLIKKYDHNLEIVDYINFVAELRNS